MKKEVHLCNVQEALDIIIGKWKAIILLTLLNKGTQRFNELHRNIPGITQKMLANQLRELESEDVVMRKVYPEIPPKVEYSITEYGKTLEPILDSMHQWGTNHLLHKAKQN